MVRVGGGWDTLEHYLDKHDPCRCTSLCECPRPQTPRLCPGVGVGGLLRVSGAICWSRGVFVALTPRCVAGGCLVWGRLFGFGGH